MPTQRASGIDRADDALRGAVQIELAVLPVRHRAARFHRMMAGGLHHERSRRRRASALLKPASRSPNDHSSVALPIGMRPSAASAKSASVHFSRLNRRPRRLAGAGVAGARHQTLPSVRAFGPPGRRLSIGSTTKGQRLEIEVDQLDRVGGDLFADRPPPRGSARRRRAARWSAQRSRAAELRAGRRR